VIAAEGECVNTCIYWRKLDLDGGICRKERFIGTDKQFQNEKLYIHNAKTLPVDRKSVSLLHTYNLMFSTPTETAKEHLSTKV
jgi:hypothetical protein